MYLTLAAIGCAGLVLGMLFKVQVLVVASLAAAGFIFGEAMVKGLSLLSASLHVVAGVALLQVTYLFGVAFGERVGDYLWPDRSGRASQFPQYGPE